ncbi:hypothetical protein D3C77_48910 [compost metagenome]
MTEVEKISAEAVRKRLKLHIEQNYNNQRHFAASMGYCDAYVSQALSGRRPLPATWLVLIGVSRLIETTYYGPVV